METLRKPLFVIAVVLLLLAVLTEVGTSLVLPAEGEVALEDALGEARKPGPAQLPDDSEVDVDDLEDLRKDNPTPSDMSSGTIDLYLRARTIAKASPAGGSALDVQRACVARAPAEGLGVGDATEKRYGFLRPGPPFARLSPRSRRLFNTA
jgi:hypothetical protein